jgi:hypothetical protein
MNFRNFNLIWIEYELNRMEINKWDCSLRPTMCDRFSAQLDWKGLSPPRPFGPRCVTGDRFPPPPVPARGFSGEIRSAGGGSLDKELPGRKPGPRGTGWRWLGGRGLTEEVWLMAAKSMAERLSMRV